MRTSILLAILLTTGVCSFAGYTITPVSHPLPIKKVNKSSSLVLFSAFNVHRQQNGVSLNWIATPANEVSSYVIKRSYDGLNFLVIDEIAPQGASWNRYRDNSAFPGYIWYQIEAVLTDGTTVCSDIEQVRIVSKK